MADARWRACGRDVDMRRVRFRSEGWGLTWSSRSKEEGGTEWEIMKHVDAVAVELVVVGYKVTR
jgi:hypothetical protein